MHTDERHVFHDLQAYLDAMTSGLRGVHRWTHYRHDHPEDGLDHAFKGTFLAMTLLALEREHGDSKDLDGERILAAATTHDIGEWLLGDVRYQVKADPRVAEPLRAIERELYEREILARLPESVRRALVHAADLQDDRESRSGRFFNAVERIGYIIYAVREHRRGHSHFLDVFARQHGAILRLGREFKSVDTLYSHLQTEVASALEAPTGRAIVERMAATSKDAAETLEWLRSRV